MKYRKVSLVVAALLGAAGCGTDSSLVGGRCKDGFGLQGGVCIALGDGPVDTFAPPGTDVAVPWAENNPGSDVGSYLTPDDEIDPDVVPPPPPPPPPPPLTCEAPLVPCYGVCIPVADDFSNCGACGKTCPSNLCVDGECVGKAVGEVIVIGHDFASAAVSSPQAHLLANAISLPTTEPIRVLSWGRGASDAEVAQVEAIGRNGIRGRSIALTNADDGALESTTLARTYDVVVIHDAAGDDPSALGARWKGALELFTQKGGVVVVVDGARTAMSELVTGAGLVSIAGHTRLASAAPLRVCRPEDSVGARVLSPYASFGASVTFQGLSLEDPDVSAVVVDDETGDPVVVHRVVR